MLVESVYKDNTHVVLMMKPMLGWDALNDPFLKSVGKQVFFGKRTKHTFNLVFFFYNFHFHLLVLSSVPREQAKPKVYKTISV